MVKIRIEGNRVSDRKALTAAKKPNQRRATKGVAKTTRPRGKPRKFQLGEEIEVLTKDDTQALDEAKKTSDGQENDLVVSNEASPLTVNKVGLVINSPRSSPNIEGVTKSTRKLECIDIALEPKSTGSNSVTVKIVPRPRARFTAKE
jgi:hypothetical protein